MAQHDVVLLNETVPQLQEVQAGDTYRMPADVEIVGDLAISGTVDGRDVAADGALAASALQPGANNSTLVNDSGFEANADLASQAEAEGGTENTKTMTALRVAQAIGSNLKNNDAGIAAPTTTDDDVAGYSVGSRWTDVVAGKVYFCVDNTTNLAVWFYASGLKADGTEPLTGNWDAGDFRIEQGSIKLKHQAVDPAHSPGMIFYHSDHGGHFVGYVEDSDVALQIGEEEWVTVRNDTGLTINDGTPVYISGYASGLPQIAPIIANGERCIGLATHAIEDGTIGKVTRGGRLSGPNYLAYSIGDTLFVSAAVAGEVTNVQPLFPTVAIELGTVLDNADPGVLNVSVEHHGNKNVIIKSYNFSARTASSGVYFLGGFYQAPAADSNLTQAGNTQAYGSANSATAGHAFMVFGAGATDGVNITLTVTGTSIDVDTGVRTAVDSEILYTGTVAGLTIHDYIQTAKKWIGAITYTLTSDGPNFSLDFNYGQCNYEDFSGIPTTLRAGDMVGLADAADAGFNMELIYHRPRDWTYHATAFVAGPEPSLNLNDDYLAESNLVAGEEFSWKRTNLLVALDPTLNEGLLMRITTSVNNSIAYLNAHMVAVAT